MERRPTSVARAACVAALAACLTACVAAETSRPTPAPTAPVLLPTTLPIAAVVAQPEPTTVPAPTGTSIPRILPTPPAAVATPEPRPAGSRLEERVFNTPALGQDMTYLVYVPAGYDTSPRRYPTVYLLHGVAGDATEWPAIGIDDAADRLIAGGQIGPMVIVFPYGDGGFYVNNPGGLAWEDYLIRDVISDVDATYRTLPYAESRAVGGLSMGGDGALQLAMRYPDVFGIAAAHSPSTRLLFEHATAAAYGNDEYFRARNPFWLAQAAPGAARIKLWIDVGVDDPWRWNATAVHAALEARGIPHDFNILPGTHDGEYWIANTERYLRFYARSLAGTN